MQATAKRGPYAKTAERRTAIADAAIDVIRDVGPVALTTAEVARRAGVSERTLFYHFPSRDHVLVAALERVDELTTAEALAQYTEDNPSHYLDQVIDLLMKSTSGEPWKAALTVALSGQAQDPNHPAHDYFVRHYAQAIEGFAALVRIHQESGLAHPDLDVVSVARRLVGVWDGLQAQWLVTPNFDLAKEVTAAYRQLSGQNVMELRQVLDDLVSGS